MGACPCSSKTNAVPHSDLFVPQFDVTVNQLHSKKLLRLKSLKSPDIHTSLKEVSTEKFIRAKALFRNTISSSHKKSPFLGHDHKPISSTTMKSPMMQPTIIAKTIINNGHSDNDATNSTDANGIKDNSYINNICNNNNCNKGKNDLSGLSTNNHTIANNTINNSVPNAMINDNITSNCETSNNVQQIGKNSCKNLSIRGESNSEMRSLKTIQCEVSEQVFSSNEEIYIANVLLHHYLFHKATNVVVNYLLSEINEFQIEKDAPIFYEGDEGTCLFIIKKGKVELSTKRSKNKFIIKEGEIFGELALLKEGVRRTYTARSLSYLEFYIIDINAFKEIGDKLRIKTNFNFALFNYIDIESRENIDLLSAELEFKKGSTIQDIIGIFGVESGSLSLVDKNGNELATFNTGEVYGVKNVIGDNKGNHSEERTISRGNSLSNPCKIVVNENSKYLVIPQMAFIEVFGVDYQDVILNKVFFNIIEKNLAFSDFVSESKNKLLDLFEIKKYSKNEIIHRHVYENKEDKKVKIILNGMIRDVNETNGENYGNASGRILGDEFITGKKLKSDIVVEKSRVICLECPWEKLKENILIKGISIQSIFNKLRNLFLFYNIEEYKIIKSAKWFKNEKFNKDQIIIPKGKKCERVYYIHKGKCKMMIDKEKVRMYSSGNSFGELDILNPKETKMQYMCCENNTELFYLNQKDFFELMSDETLNTKTKKKICLEDIEIFPSNLYYLSTLYRGNSSNVYLMHNKMFLCVVKSVFIGDSNKAKVNDKLVKNVINEKKISKRINHPFIIHYVKTLKNSQWCFFIQEYIHGITLQEYIEMCKPSQDRSLIQFYSACLFIILHYLSTNGIIHRDIKPSNLMLDTQGYLKMIDFSSAKSIKNKRTKTLIGTPFFTAPEVLSGKGYSFSVDYWSVGVVLYYLFYGEYPFGSSAKQPDAAYKEILNKKLTFQNYGQNVEVESLIEGLLKKNENERLCSFKQIENLGIFKNFNWNKLRRMELSAPFIPQVVKISEEKMLKDTSKKFNDFIANEKIDKNSIPVKLDKDVVMSSIDEINGNDNFTKINETNWFDIF